MSTELGKMLSDVAFSSSLHPFGANRGSWIQNLYNLSIKNCPNHCLIKHFCLSALVNFLDDCYSNFLGNFLNNRFLRERGMASIPKMEYQVFLCIFQKNSQRNFLISFKSKVAIAKFVWKMPKKSGIMKSGLDVMPFFLLDDLLRENLRGMRKFRTQNSILSCPNYFCNLCAD